MVHPFLTLVELCRQGRHPSGGSDWSETHFLSRSTNQTLGSSRHANETAKVI